MEPVTMALIGSALAPAIGGIVGNIMGSGDRDAAREAQARALKEMLDLQVPNPEDQKIYLQKLVSQGQLSPEMEAYISAAPSKMEGVSTDPRLKEAQMKALAQMQDLGKTGFNAEDKMVLNKVAADTARQSQGRDQAIMQNMAMRGMGGSGQELAARMMSAQQATQNQAEEGDRVAAMAQRRALESIAQAGGMAGSIRNQDFDQQSAVARAQDEINRFNTQNRISAGQRNTDRTNAARQYNLSEAQRIADTNVGLGNQQEIHNKGLSQQNFENRYRRAAGAAGAYNQEAQNRSAEAQAVGNMWAGIGSGAGRTAGAVAMMSGSTNAPRTASTAEVNDTLQGLDDLKKIKPSWIK